MNTKARFGNRFRSKLPGIIPSASRDCSTYQFRCASLSELEFHEMVANREGFLMISFIFALGVFGIHKPQYFIDPDLNISAGILTRAS